MEIIKLLTGKEKGVTLLELLIVITLTGIIMAVVTPAFEQLIASITRESTEEKVLNFFTGVRAQAISSNQTEVVVIKKGEVFFLSKDGKNLKISNNIKEIKANKGQNEVRFYSDGRVSIDEILFKLENGAEFKIIADSITGVIKLSGTDD